jgi:hypothetical protein
MSKFIKKEISCDKYLFYCWLSMGSKSKRIRKKATNIVDYQIHEYLYW